MARAARQIATREDRQIVAQALLATFASEIRRWIAVDEPELEPGLARLRRMLDMQITGLKPLSRSSGNARSR
jgi:hypothetical protein